MQARDDPCIVFRRIFAGDFFRDDAADLRQCTTLLTGWGFAGRRMVTGMIVAAGAVKNAASRRDIKHHSAYHRVFAAARWSPDELRLAIFGQLILPPTSDAVIWLSLDDTLARKRGDRLPTPRPMLQQRAKRPTPNIHARRDRSRIAETVDRAYKAPDWPLKVVALEPQTGDRKVQAFYFRRTRTTRPKRCCGDSHRDGRSKRRTRRPRRIWVLNNRRAGRARLSGARRRRPCCCIP